MQPHLLFIKPALKDFVVTWGQQKQAITCDISGKYNMRLQMSQMLNYWYIVTV